MNEVISILYVCANVIISATALFLIISPRYEDGIFGRAALGVSVFGSVIVIYYAFLKGAQYEPYTESVAVALGFAVFLVWHALKQCGLFRLGKHERRNGERRHNLLRLNNGTDHSGIVH